jgi:predicted RNA binding protein YcfA (HicA-like mRNA interferase family)
MGEKIRQFTAKELERLLTRYGFVHVSQKGSHRKWRISKQAGWSLCPIMPERIYPLEHF